MRSRKVEIEIKVNRGPSMPHRKSAANGLSKPKIWLFKVNIIGQRF
jgi:hypothetical protein